MRRSDPSEFNMSTGEIARMLGVSHQAVCQSIDRTVRRLWRMTLPQNGWMRGEVWCEWCGRSFVARSRDQRTCSNKCSSLLYVDQHREVVRDGQRRRRAAARAA